MGKYNVGLPGAAKKAFSSAIGSTKVLPYASGAIEKDSEGCEWLQAGYGVLATSYPKAARLPSLQLHGVATTLSASIGGGGSVTTPVRIASNGTGVVLIAYGSATLLRSTDYGKTWVTTSSTGINVVEVIWNPVAQRFYIFANTATQAQGLMSTDATGSAWNAVFTSALSTATVGAIRGAVNSSTGTIAVFTGSTATNSAILTVASGAQAFVARTSPIGTNNANWSVDSNNVTTFAGAFVSGTGSLLTSTDDGVTWASGSGSITCPAGLVYHALSGLWLISASGGSGNYYTTSNITSAASTWTLRSLPDGWSANNSYSQQFTKVGNSICAGLNNASTNSSVKEFYTSIDGINWNVRGLTFTSNDAPRITEVGGGNLLITQVYASNTAAYTSKGLDLPDYVGLSRGAASAMSIASNTARNWNLYVRIK